MFFYTQNIVGFSLFVSFSIVCVIVNSVCAVLLAIQQNKVWIHLYSTHFSRIIFLCFACVFFAFYFFFWLETRSFEWYFFRRFVAWDRYIEKWWCKQYHKWALKIAVEIEMNRRIEKCRGEKVILDVVHVCAIANTKWKMMFEPIRYHRVALKILHLNHNNYQPLIWSYTEETLHRQIINVLVRSQFGL